HLQQQKQSQQQQQQPFQFSATPLFSSPLALQQQPATGSSLRNFPAQQGQGPQHPQVQQLQQQETGYMQYQQQQQQQLTPQGQGFGGPTSSQGFIPTTSGYPSGVTGGGGNVGGNRAGFPAEDYSNFSLFPQQDANNVTTSSAAVGAGSSTAAPASSSSTSMPMTTIAGGGGGGSSSPGLLQDPNVMSAVPNPFFGVPNTIDWDEWQQYISNAGLQKF
ncbi:hypothetical protein BGX29_002650, partial [Mortierella sp. GBA35]